RYIFNDFNSLRIHGEFNMAELAGLPSPRMDWHSSDVPQALRKFKATCELYFSGPLTAKSEEEKISYLLIWSGEEGIELVSTWSLTNDEKKKLSTYWKKFEEYVAPKSNFRLARVPEALREPLRKELESLVKQEIIAKVDKPTDWVNSLVCATKRNGTLWLCLDPKDLNKAIKRPHHCTPTLDEVLSRWSGSKHYSIVDARSGYWNIKLDHESSLYTTFNSPHGRYRFLRLPFGLICAQDIFQKKVDETFGDLPGVTGIADDIVVYGNDLSEHDTNLKAVMERA
ncbi:hypothetical protein QZH41_008990, partial [Actinostola sp. cb2023]